MVLTNVFPTTNCSFHLTTSCSFRLNNAGGLRSSPLRLKISRHQRLLSSASRLRIFALSSNDIKAGTNIEVDGAPWRVLEFLHVKPGKGAAFVRTKLRNYLSGNTVEKTFRAGANIDEANIVKELKQYTYRDGELFVFMDMTSYEESQLNASELGDKTKWLKEGMECAVLSWKGQIIDVELPTNATYKVIDGEVGVKGDREKAGTKQVTIETGATLNVPMFIDVGELIVVDTRTGSYVTRA
eukprot:TRINITY_DN5979_c0_g1_i3.p1 TRINITY_DN5979_c0_g1~~TRINITY_DN5979_c0_g1_i3.p1  ORF type:complete len:241 (+),score=36.61 TRINITY_DN5979_c0_g1_i3:238-960(+)